MKIPSSLNRAFAKSLGEFMRFLKRKTNNMNWGLKTDLLWFLVILAWILFIVSLIPIIPNDFWWHLKIGELIFTEKVIPTTNIYAWTLDSDTPFIYGAWLGELLFYILYQWGDLPLVIFFRNILALATYLLVGTEVHRRSGSWRISAFVTALTFLMTVNNLTIRPQNWSWLLFIFNIILLSKYIDGRIPKQSLILSPLIMIFWVNVHGSFVLAGTIIIIFFVGELLKKIIRDSEALAWKEISWIGFIGLLTGLATLINPRSIEIIDYVTKLMTDRPSQQLGIEWQSPTPEGIANSAFYISVILLLSIFAYSRFRPSITKAFTIIGFLWLAWSGQRYIIWYGLAVMPIMAESIKELPFQMKLFQPKYKLVNWLIIILVFSPSIFVQPWFVDRAPLPERYSQQVIQGSNAGPLVSVKTPVAAVEYLKNHPGGKIYNEMGYGSYMIWAIPEQGVFIDPRIELFPYEQWQDYIKINLGIDYNDLLDKYGVNRILLSVEMQTGLAKYLEQNPSWQMEYEDDYAQIWFK